MLEDIMNSVTPVLILLDVCLLNNLSCCAFLQPCIWAELYSLKQVLSLGKKISTWKIVFEFQKVIPSLWSNDRQWCDILVHSSEDKMWALDHRGALIHFTTAYKFIWNHQVAVLHLELNLEKESELYASILRFGSTHSCLSVKFSIWMQCKSVCLLLMQPDSIL